MTVYFDNNATAPLRDKAKAAMLLAFDAVGNPSSVHAAGRAAKSAMETARGQLAKHLGCLTNEIIFTSGGTESNNLAITNAMNSQNCASILVGASEHPSILLPAQQSGIAALFVPVLPDGLLDIPALREIISQQDGPFLLAIMQANNETGVVQDLAPIAELVHAAGGFLHVDAAQAFGKIPVDFAKSGADSMTVVAHKIGGPGGIGALVVRSGLAVSAQMLGGGQENNRRAGTSNVPAICGFSAAADEACADLEIFAKLAVKRDRLADLLRQNAPQLQVFGQSSHRLPNTLCCAAPGFAAETQVMALDLAGFAISSGSACGSGKVKPSHVLTAMGIGDELSRCAIRISLGWLTTDDEIEQFADAWGEAYRRAVSREVA
ncbi:Cysteine desulfurase [hydrothermal vent metagenome]|uniref:Cysteine desulfurase n=1 Tax=hydrothermal vent metagenome TaxID=652676 RepID=A0A3B0RYI0_9ZZZZ